MSLVALSSTLCHALPKNNANLKKSIRKHARIKRESCGFFELRDSNMPKYGQVMPLSLSETRLCRKNAVILTAIIGAISSAMIVSSGTVVDAFLFNGRHIPPILDRLSQKTQVPLSQQTAQLVEKWLFNHDSNLLLAFNHAQISMDFPRCLLSENAKLHPQHDKCFSSPYPSAQ
jgi:hypothetical protein